MPCYVLLEEEVHPVRQPAVRLKKAKCTKPPEHDDGEYEILRPGLMISSNPCDDGSFLTTTSGVLVQDRSGERYLTVAAHGFANHGTMHHPNIDGRAIGTVFKDFSPGFDIALVKLEIGAKFVNETFEASEGDKGCKLMSLASIRSLRRGDLVYMDNPYIGRCDGQIGPMSYDTWIGDEEEQFWIHVGMWIWTGQDSSGIMPDSICGTPLSNDEDEVVGFIRCVGVGALEGYCYCTAAENLRLKQYEICKEYE